MTQEEHRPRQTYKSEHVRLLFDSIAHKYDFLNHILSSGVDILWRRRVVKLLRPYKPKHILDIATGTADLAIETARLQPVSIVGVDISSKMLERGRKKVEAKNLDSIITLEIGEAERLRFESGSFDAIVSAFGVRNFENLGRGLKELHRILRIGGIAVILEFSRPRASLVRHIYKYYSRNILPAVGGFISKNRQAYEYLPSTAANFPDGEDFCAILRFIGFDTAVWFPQTFGIATIYVAEKKK